MFVAGLAKAEPLDLEGTWYVLVHYKDSHAPNPDEERWEDKVWVFERKGRRIHWAEYPIVVFDDEAGRFERRSTGQYARILHHWEPNASQRSDIANGLQVNNRGVKKKRLRGSDENGWTSGRSTGAASASVVTYQEVWSVEGMPDAPVFARSDFMGGGRTDSMEGRVEYAATEVRGNREISGRYARDGHRTGTFRMMRSGPTGALKSKKTQADLQRQGFARSVEANPALRAQVAEAIELELRAQGLALSDREIETLMQESLAWSAQGVSQAEIAHRIGRRARVLAYGFAPSGAVHAPEHRYRWPFEAAEARPLLLGPEGTPSPGLHRPEELAGGYWFDVESGTRVVAARAGTVQRIVDGHPDGGPEPEMAPKTNLVIVTHDDGSFGLYAHLKRGIDLELGQRVEAGDRLGRSGASGRIPQPALLFAVQRAGDDGSVESLPIAFEGAPDGLRSGERYGGAASE